VFIAFCLSELFRLAKGKIEPWMSMIRIS